MSMFRVGDIINTTCIYTGGKHKYEIYSRTANAILCRAVKNELDGTHKANEMFEVYKDENGEYIVLWRYKGHEGIHRPGGR